MVEHKYNYRDKIYHLAFDASLNDAKVNVYEIETIHLHPEGNSYTMRHNKLTFNENEIFPTLDEAIQNGVKIVEEQSKKKISTINLAKIGFNNQ